MTLASTLPRSADHMQPNWLVRLFDYKPFLIVICLTPAIGLLAVFLTYPLGLGVWLAFTDTTIGRRGVFVGKTKRFRRVENCFVAAAAWCVIPGRCKASNPESRDEAFKC